MKLRMGTWSGFGESWYEMYILQMCPTESCSDSVAGDSFYHTIIQKRGCTFGPFTYLCGI